MKTKVGKASHQLVLRGYTSVINDSLHSIGQITPVSCIFEQFLCLRTTHSGIHWSVLVCHCSISSWGYALRLTTNYLSDLHLVSSVAKAAHEFLLCWSGPCFFCLCGTAHCLAAAIHFALENSQSLAPQSFDLLLHLFRPRNSLHDMCASEASSTETYPNHDTDALLPSRNDQASNRGHRRPAHTE